MIWLLISDIQIYREEVAEMVLQKKNTKIIHSWSICRYVAYIFLIIEKVNLDDLNVYLDTLDT